ncbi:MAG: hypothetical protein K9N47_21155 [Prosthecobacter sp.]|uniref:hypothetical protein n=1 Tax=Prosthecobacter sp. TaxID=1965333 RepID=UPI002609712E|nr:hypothetical protein [Prosthecobacter sp.]MCF7788645.1 hypothetical protein [Prosthecobacter sp.]
MTLALQQPDNDAISGLPPKWRTEFNSRFLTMQQFGNGQLTKLEAMERMHVSRATFDRLVTKVKEMGWAGLVPQYKGVGAPAADGLPAEFISFWKVLVEGNQRKTAPAYRLLIRLWRTRQPFEFQEVKYKSIPGFEGWPGWPNIPSGWGGKGRNLYRHQPKKLALTALRQGLGRARDLYGPKSISTRVGLWHMSHVQFDDVWLDLKAHLLDSKKLVRPQQLGALELLSGSRFAYGMKPQLWRADGTRESLNEGDMRFLFASVLLQHGISARGTTFIVEHGTAAIRRDVREIMQRAFGDLVKFEDSGMLGDLQAITGMGDGRGGKGNPMHKAHLESLHNLIHNEMAFLPGQTGHDRDAPEFLGVIERHDEKLLSLAKRLPLDVMKLFRFRTFEWHTQLVPLVAGVLDMINKRDDHDLEGWAALGFLTRQYRLMPESNEWVNEDRLLALPAPTRNAFLAMADEDQRCWQPRRLSPHDVFTRGAATSEMIKVPESVIAEILYQDLAKPRKLGHDGVFSFEDREIGAGEHTFDGLVTCPDGREMRLQDGETYETVLNPFDPKKLWVYSGTRQRGAFLGLASPVQRHCRADADASKDAFKRSAKALAERLAPTRRRNAHLTTNETARNKHNTRVLTDHEQAKADFTRRATSLLNASTADHANNTTANTDHENTNEPDW